MTLDQEITIDEAIKMVKDKNGSMPPYYCITGLDLRNCEYIKEYSVYNHLYYKYKDTIIYVEYDDDVSSMVYVCDNNRNIIGYLGSRYYDCDDDPLYTEW